MRHSNVLHRLLTLGKRNYPHHRGRVSLRASDGKLVKHTTEMILWSMILSLKCLGQSYDATSWESAGFMLSQTYYGNFAQWRYSNQWSNREVLLLLVENYTQCPAPTRWNTLVCGNFWLALRGQGTLIFDPYHTTHRFSAFWLRSKCSICSYQLNIWYGDHVSPSILNWFL